MGTRHDNSAKNARAGRAQQKEHVNLDLAGIRASALEAWRSFLYGNRFGSIAACKGEPGAAELGGQPPFFGADGEALERGLAALGWGSNAWCGIALQLPGKGTLCEETVRILLELLDPRVILALDRPAILSIQKCFGDLVMPTIPKPGVRSTVLGRVVVYVEDFEAALSSGDSTEAKRRVWQQLKAIKI